MNLRFIALLILIGSVCVFGYQINNIPKIEQEYANLLAEYNEQTSWSSIGASWLRSAVGGWTGNISAVFAESQHWEKLGAQFTQRRTELVDSYSSAITQKKWALGLFVGSAVVLLLTNHSAGKENKN